MALEHSVLRLPQVLQTLIDAGDALHAALSPEDPVTDDDRPLNTLHALCVRIVERRQQEGEVTQVKVEPLRARCLRFLRSWEPLVTAIGLLTMPEHAEALRCADLVDQLIGAGLKDLGMGAPRNSELAAIIEAENHDEHAATETARFAREVGLVRRLQDVDHAAARALDFVTMMHDDGDLDPAEPSDSESGSDSDSGAPGAKRPRR